MNLILRPQRNLDIKGASLLQQQVHQFVKRSKMSPQSYWIIDLVDVECIDHFGLFALVKLRRLARQHSCHLRLCNAKKPILLMLEIAELDRKFKILKTLEDLSASKIRLLLC
jgi:anti-sigma B factor antagonist